MLTCRAFCTGRLALQFQGVEAVVRAADSLGECPIWDGRTGRLLWVDINRRTLQGCDAGGGGRSVQPLAAAVGSFALTADPGLLLAAGAEGYGWLDRRAGRLIPISNPEPDATEHRFNDGRCDRQGRFWAGTMCDPRRVPEGSLYRLDPDLNWSKWRENITVPNSIAFSPDGRTMYFADTPTRRILAFDYEPDDGTIRGERLLIDLADQPGRPDGAAVDADGCLWSAAYAGGRVTRITPDGRIDRTFRVPAENATCCCFGGPDLGTLSITTARQRLDEAALATQPLAGSLFAIRPGVGGLPEVPFAGRPPSTAKKPIVG